MEMNQASNRIHPLMAGAAISVMLVSLVGIAAISGILPTSHGTAVPNSASAPSAFAQETRMVSAQAATQSQQNSPVQYQQPEPVVHHRPVAHRVVHQHAVRTQPVVYAQTEPTHPYSSEPVYQHNAPATQNSPVGIGVGAVIGGLLGSQVGGGNGRTLATVAGAIGGGYVGNEIAKRNY